MKYYVMTDTHGFFSIFMKTLTEAGFFDETDPCKLILCGDVLDRGQEACELVDFLISLLHKDKLIFVMGNHDQLLVECLQAIARGAVEEIANGNSHHYRNKTWDTLLQLSGMTALEAYNNPNELIRLVMASPYYQVLLPAAIDYYETDHYIFVHGWIPSIVTGEKPDFAYSYNPDWRNADPLAWRKARWLHPIELACRHKVLEPGKTVVCGHKTASYGHAHFGKGTPQWGEDADFTPFRAEGIWAIDASTVNSSHMNCIVIED